MKDDADKLRSLVNASGFVFQLALEDAIKRSVERHGWQIAVREYPWRTERHVGFADLILSRGPFRLIIEAKRHRDAEWVFLMPEPKQSQRSHARIMWTDTVPGGPPLSGWGDIQVYPASPEADFCVVRGQGEKDRPLLERLGAGLIDTVEGVGSDLLDLHARGSSTHVLIPLIVTTATLYLAHFDVHDVPLRTGEISAGNFIQVPSVRFRKSLSRTSEHLTPELSELEHLAKNAERTAFIVTAEHLVDWLEDFETNNNGFMPWHVARRAV